MRGNFPLEANELEFNYKLLGKCIAVPATVKRVWSCPLQSSPCFNLFTRCEPAVLHFQFLQLVPYLNVYFVYLQVYKLQANFYILSILAQTYKKRTTFIKDLKYL